MSVPDPDHKKTYRSEAETYDLLISREDHQGNLLREIERIRKPDDLEILDLGAGTGRLGFLLSERAKSFTALDVSPSMLSYAGRKMRGRGMPFFQICAGDHRALPLRSRSFDLVLSGWSICYLADWFPQTWEKELATALAEIRRVARPGGMVILIETQGTGYESPHPPQHLEAYFHFLRDEGFRFSWVRTDYQFISIEEAVSVSRFFFGDELSSRVEKGESLILPECTGFFWKTL